MLWRRTTNRPCYKYCYCYFCGMKTVHILISGKVQGVFFRASASTEAEKNNITGWIKNTKSGEVEAMASGEEKDIESFIQWCHQGPRKAGVENVEVEEVHPQPFDSFRVIH